MSAFDAYVQAKYHGGTMAGGPCFTVIHDAETPLRAGYADSIAEFFRKGPAAGTSAHAMVDPSKAIKQLPDNVVAYAAGPKANPHGWHLEQAGYAKFTPAQWVTPDGLAQAHRVAACLREVHDQWGIPKRWMTDDQLRRAAAGDRASGGMTTHQQVTRVIGGTTHTDPEENYPRGLLLELLLGTPTVPAPTSEEDDTMKYSSFRSDNTKGGSGEIRISGPLVWEYIPTPAHYGMLVQDGMISPYRDVSPPVFDYYGAINLSPLRTLGAGPAVHGLMAPVSEVMQAALKVTEEEARAAITDPALLAEVDRLTAEARAVSA